MSVVADKLVIFEDKVARLWEEGKINAPVHLSGGNEGLLIELFKSIKKDDWVFSTHRNHFHALLKGVSENELMAEILGTKEGLCGGKGRSMCTIDTRHKFYSSPILAAMCPVAVGVACVEKERGLGNSVWCFIGDGASDEGHFWEALRYAQCQDLPITFVVEDNDRSTCVDKMTRWGIHQDGGQVWPGTKVIRHIYYPKYPHVGTGKYVNF